MKVEYNLDAHNKFEFQLLDKDGNVKQSATAYNTVLNLYYDNLAKNTGCNFNAIFLGTGTGTPAPSDTALFNKIAEKSIGFPTDSVQYLQLNQYSVSASVTFTEAEAIGLITEVGIASVYGNVRSLYTHAMLTDAEGHIISINKTDTDRLIITATTYLTLSRPSNIVPVKGLSMNSTAIYAEQVATTGCSLLEFIVRAGLGLGGYAIWNSNEVRVYPVLAPGCCYSSTNTSYMSAYSITGSSSVVNGIIRFTSGRVLSTEQNLQGTYQIYAFNTPVGYLPITSEVFTPVELTLSKTADGNTTGFNFEIAELMDDVKVYINDVLQPANSYTWNGKDYTNTFQSWETCRGDHVTVAPTFMAPSNINQQWCTPLFNQSYSIGNSPAISNYNILYDFGEVLEFTRAYKPNASTAYDTWESSLDGTTWNTVSIPAAPSGNYYDFPTPVRARYLRMETALVRGHWSNYWTPPLPELCCFSNQLEFNTAPPEGSIIKVEAKSAYPIKNSNWIIDQIVLDLKVGRGS